MVDAPAYPSSVYLITLGVFSGANMLFHSRVFRRSGNRSQYLAFMLVNGFTSFNIAETLSYGAKAHYATTFNNAQEMDHRLKMNEALRLKIYKGAAATQ